MRRGAETASEMEARLVGVGVFLQFLLRQLLHLSEAARVGGLSLPTVSPLRPTPVLSLSPRAQLTSFCLSFSLPAQLHVDIVSSGRAHPSLSVATPHFLHLTHQIDTSAEILLVIRDHRLRAARWSSFARWRSDRAPPEGPERCLIGWDVDLSCP